MTLVSEMGHYDTVKEEVKSVAPQGGGVGLFSSVLTCHSKVHPPHTHPLIALPVIIAKWPIQASCTSLWDSFVPYSEC